MNSQRLTQPLLHAFASAEEDVLHGRAEEAERLSSSRRIPFAVQFEHRLVRVGVDKVLGRDPRRELLLNVELRVVVAGSSLLGAVGVTGILQRAEPDLHRLGEANHLGLGHLEHLLLVRDVHRALDHPETLVVALTDKLHEFLQRSAGSASPP